MCKDITALMAHIVIVTTVILEINAPTAKSFSNHSSFDCLKDLTPNKSVNVDMSTWF